MTRTTAVLLAFSLGAVAGSRLPVLHAWWRRFWRARTFKPVLLRQFQPAVRVQGRERS